MFKFRKITNIDDEKTVFSFEHKKVFIFLKWWAENMPVLADRFFIEYNESWSRLRRQGNVFQLSPK